MNERETQEGRCANEACGRRAEPDEGYCAECGLERSLYFREEREGPASIRTSPWPESPGR